jgi:hypothetical protein
MKRPVFNPMSLLWTTFEFNAHPIASLVQLVPLQSDTQKGRIPGRTSKDWGDYLRKLERMRTQDGFMCARADSSRKGVFRSHNHNFPIQKLKLGTKGSIVLYFNYYFALALSGPPHPGFNIAKAAFSDAAMFEAKAPGPDGPGS